MKKIICTYAFFLCIQFLASAQCTDCGKLAIGAMIEYNGSDDAYLLCTTEAIEDLSIYRVFSRVSGDVTNSNYWASQPFNLPPISLPADTCFWITDEVGADFVEFFGAEALIDEDDTDLSTSDDLNSVPTHSGKQDVYIMCAGNIDDFYFGNTTMSFNNPNSYNEGFALSNSNRCPNGGEFNFDNWTVVEDATDNMDNITEVIGFPSNYVYDASNCPAINICGGIEICADPIYFCVSNSFGNDYFVGINYLGFDPSAVTENPGGTFTANSTDPAVTPNGLIILELSAQGDPWGVIITTADGCEITRYGIGAIGDCENLSCLVANDVSSSCLNGTLQISASPNGPGAGTMGYSIAPSDGIGTIDPTTATYGGTSNFVLSGYNAATVAGGTVSVTITDLETACTFDLPVEDACFGMTTSTCTDGLMNGNETGIDCGGPDCEECAIAPTCDDGLMNGDETGVDCGGPNCEECVIAPTCDDGLMNGDETGVDCGGATCPVCQMGTPTISILEDPCACDDPNNIDTDMNGVVDLFFETVIITSTPGETWSTDVGSTGILNITATAATANFTENPPGTYTATFYHTSGAGYNASFSNGTTTLPAVNACASGCTMGPDTTAIPTMSEWGLIILTLLTLTFVTVTTTAKEGSLANINMTSSQLTQLKFYPFNAAIFNKASIFTAAIALIAAIITLMVYGSITMTDSIGTIIAAPIFAYFMHLLIMINIKENK